VQLRFACAWRDAEQPGRFVMAVAVDANQHQNIAGAGRQQPHGLLKIDWARRIDVAGNRRDSLCMPFGAKQLGLSAGSTATQYGVHGDTVQPGTEATATLKGRQTAPGRHKSFLSAVLSQFALAGQSQAKAVHPPGVRAVQGLEGREISGRRPRNRRSVFGDSCVAARWSLEGNYGHC
jgi:hypothetical protein